MKDRLERRLHELQAEFAAGKKAIADLEAKQLNIRNTMLRIDGAIQVLEELMKEESPDQQRDLYQTNGVAV